MAVLRARMSKGSRAALRRRAGRISLFPAVVLALLVGLGVACAAYWFLRWSTPVDSSKAAAEIDVTRVALTVVAGVGGVVALVIAYRRQRDLEQSRFVERFGAAAAQLGATDVAVRLAGVYAMAGVADESDGRRRQQCIDVLCGYLRLPYDVAHGASGRTKLVVKAPRVERGRIQGEIEEHVEYRQNDREVRATIIRVIADHLRPSAEHSWSANDFDFRTAHLENADFSQTTFDGIVRFSDATFTGIARFSEVTFTGDVWFARANFLSEALFSKATFDRAALFGDATFHGFAQFDDATFTDAMFSRATFNSEAYFGGATFTNEAWFGHATFISEVHFIGVIFKSKVRFHSVNFAGEARFDDAIFPGITLFNRASFNSNASFDGATFVGGSFAEVDFGSGVVSFMNPKQWGPPAPGFDWDHNNTRQKPANVKPQVWPPTVRPES